MRDDEHELSGIDEAARRRFESTWRQGRPEPIEACAPPAGAPSYLATLEELACIELELAWRARRPDQPAPPGADHYLDRFPALRDPAVARRLREQEFLVRTRFGDRPDPVAFAAAHADLGVSAGALAAVAALAGPAPATAGVALGRYRVRGEHARGGFGRVLAADDPELERVVAIKQLTPRAAADERARRRFVSEARITARLDHPGVVPVYELSDAGGAAPYYTMKLVRGRTLAAAIEEAHDGDELARARLLEAVLALARTVAFAHSRGVIHRDLKPDNVVLGDYGETLLLDWGLAKVVGAGDEEPGPAVVPAAPGLTRAGDVLGTPEYMAPEQARGDLAAVDERSDVYALGAILYHVLTGRPPYLGGSGDEVLEALRAGPPPSPRELAPDAPAELISITDRAMARDPAARYPSAAELAAQLEQYQAGQLVGAHRYSLPDLVGRWLRRHRAAAAAALLGVALIAATVVIATQQGRERARARRARARDLAQLVERGRGELLAGEPHRAAVLLAEAYRLGERGPGLRSLLADALRPLDALDLIVDASGVERLAFSPDGMRLSAGGGTEVRVWDAASGAPVATIAGGPAVAFAPDGNRIATGGDQPALWQADGTRVAALGAGPVASLVFSSDSARLLSAGDGSSLWDGQTGQLLGVVAAGGDKVDDAGFCGAGLVVALADGADNAAIWHEGAAPLAFLGRPPGDTFVTAMACATGRSRLATADNRGTVRVSNLLGAETPFGPTSATLTERAMGVRALALSPDGSRLAIAAADGAGLWDTADGALVNRLPGHVGAVDAVAFGAGGALIATAGQDGRARVWETASQRLVASFDAHLGEVTAIAFSPDGKRLATACRDDHVRIWSLARGKLAATLAGHDGAVLAVDVSPDGGLILTGAADHTGRLWDARTGAFVIALPGHRLEVTVARFGAGGARAVTAGRDRTARVWDPRSGSLLQVVTAHEGEPGLRDADGGSGEPMNAVFSPDGALLVTSSWQARVWRADGAEPVAVLDRHGHDVPAAAFFPDGSRLATVSGDATAIVWDTATWQPLHVLRGHADRLFAVDVSGDGRRLVTAGWDRAPRLWDPRDGGAIAELGGHQDATPWAVFDPAGARIATASRDGTARLFDGRTGAPLAVLAGHQGEVVVARFDPSGQRVATAGADGTVRLWDAATGRPLAVLSGHRGPVRAIAFYPDGRRLVSAGADGTARIWEVGLEARTPDEVVALVRRQVPWRLVDEVLVPAPR